MWMQVLALHKFRRDSSTPELTMREGRCDYENEVKEITCDFYSLVLDAIIEVPVASNA